MKIKYLIAALTVFGVAGGAYATTQQMHDKHKEMSVQANAGSLTLSNATARFLIAGRPGAVFLKIENKGGADKLISASSSVSNKVELHTHTMDNGVMKMRRVETIDVPANSVTELKSGGHHIMMFNVKDLPKKGSKIPLSLTFEKAGKVQIHAVAGEPDAKHSH